MLTSPMSVPHGSGEAVVLVHGLAAKPLVMLPLAHRLAGHFGKVVNWGYPSLFSPIERHGTRLAAFLREVDGQVERLHLVTHSMGGLIARLALSEFRPQTLGRVVMLAPPNRGSIIATTFAPWLGRVCPPLTQLVEGDDSFACRLPLPEIRELGVIAAAMDFLVREHSTHLSGETDHITLPGLHSSLVWRRETADQVRHFLQHGRFRRAAA